MTMVFPGTALLAQDGESSIPFTISGSVDAYFRSNLNSTNDTENGGDLAPATSFANLPGFSLGMANIVGSIEGEKVGFVTDFVFGPRGDEAVFGSVDPSGDPSNRAIVNQLYTYLNVGEHLTFTLGNFNTFLGYEVISPTGNFNYSTSYMFSYGPFSHTGLKADLSFDNGFSFMAGIFNPTDATDFNPSGSYVGGVQLGYEGGAGGTWVNFLFEDGFYQLDLTTGYDITEKVYLGLNSTTASDSFWGVAGYVQTSLTESFGLGIRGEYFTDKGLGVLTEDESVIDVTISGNYTVGGLTIIPEFRLDAFSEDDVVMTDGLKGETANSLSSFLLAAVYAF